MKNAKLLLVALFVSAAAFTACSKDDNNSTAASIEGKWYLSKEGVSASGQEVLTAHTNECATKKDYVEFVTGGTYNDVSYLDDCTSDASAGTWTKSGNTLTITEDGETSTTTINSLTSSELKVTVTYEGANYVTVFTKN